MVAGMNANNLIGYVNSVLVSIMLGLFEGLPPSLIILCVIIAVNLFHILIGGHKPKKDGKL